MSLEIGLSIEGQEGVSWQQWLTLAHVAENCGFATLYRSDHYLSERKESRRDALDAWGTICGLAAKTSQIRLGTLVSPVTFRHPSVLAKLAVTANHISGGRVDVGIGTGWYADEHAAYGFELPDLRVRVEMLEEQLEIVRRTWDAGSFSFRGRHYQLVNNDARPKPLAARPRLILGGKGGPRSVALAARWADEYNVVESTPDEIKRHRTALTVACDRIGRDPMTLRLSMLVGVVTGNDQSEIEKRGARACEFLGYESARRSAMVNTLPKTWLVGTPEQLVEQLAVLESVGLAKILLWPPLHDDLEMISLVGTSMLADAGA